MSEPPVSVLIMGHVCVHHGECPGSHGQIFPDVSTFPDGGARCPLFMFESDLLECHKVVCELAFAFVNSGIGTLGNEEQLQERNLRLQGVPTDPHPYHGPPGCPSPRPTCPA